MGQFLRYMFVVLAQLWHAAQTESERTRASGAFTVCISSPHCLGCGYLLVDYHTHGVPRVASLPPPLVCLTEYALARTPIAQVPRPSNGLSFFFSFLSILSVSIDARREIGSRCPDILPRRLNPVPELVDILTPLAEPLTHAGDLAHVQNAGLHPCEVDDFVDLVDGATHETQA